MNQKSIYYFAYGMLTDPDYMQNAYLVGPGVLDNYRFDLLQYANVTPDPGNQVMGALWQIDQDMLEDLDQIEGYPALYTRKTVKINCRNKIYSAQVYTMTLNTLQHLKNTMPAESYLDRIVKGYRHAGIPLDQLYNALE